MARNRSPPNPHMRRRSSPPKGDATAASPDGSYTSEASKEELVSISELSVPESVLVGERFEVGITVKNDATFINPLDPDHCLDPSVGYKVEVVADRAGKTLNREVCVPALGTSEIVYSAGSFDTVGSKPLDVTVTGVGSGRALASQSRVVAVSSESDDGGGGGGDGGGGNGDDGSNDGGGGGDGGNDDDNNGDQQDAGLREFWDGLSRGEKITAGLVGGAALLVATDQGQRRRRR